MQRSPKPATSPPPPRVKRWSKSEYRELTARGAFRDQRIYLFRGELIEMSPQLHPHQFAVMQLDVALHKAFGVDAGYRVRIQLPFDAPGDSTPEPDGAVCTQEQSLREPEPDQALLLIEVADSSLSADREMALEYAAAQVPEYWIIDVNNRRIEIYREPTPDVTAALGFRYASMKIANSGESIEPVSKPGAPVAVAQFFH